LLARSPGFTAVLGVLALVLAIMGLYGVIAYSVAHRRREIGIRMALGAERSNVLRLVLREGMTLVAVGIALGTDAALGVSRVLSGMLFRVSARRRSC
jgi:ABC-type antimicrobial peptide transport system permease subunit